MIGSFTRHLLFARQAARPALFAGHASQAPFSAFANHRNTEDNNEDTPFEFTKENYEEIQNLLSKYPTNYKESACIPALFIA
jgi:NADH dehydrogenase (ubiquinone) flavoprotein 2